MSCLALPQKVAGLRVGNSSDKPSTHYVLGPASVLSGLEILHHVFITTCEGPEAQGSKVACPGSQREQAAELGF